MAQALAAAKAQIAAAQVPIQNQAAQAAQANDLHGKAIQGFSSAEADILKGIAPLTQQTYTGAADRQAIFAKGLSDGARAAIQNSAGQANDILAKQQGPGGQTVTDNSQAAGDVLYGLGGYIPATDFNREGAAYTAAAQFLPANALRQGQQDYTSNIFAGNADQQGFANQLAAISASTPAVANDIYASLQDMLFKKQTLADSEKKTAFDQGLALTKLGDSRANTKFDQSYKLSQAQVSADFKQQGLNIQAAKLNQALAAGARPNASLSKVYGYVVDSLGNQIAGPGGRPIAVKSKSGKAPYTPTQIANYQGLLQQGIDTLPKDATYLSFVKQAVGHKVPWQLAVQRANAQWPSTQRPTPEALSQAIGVSKKQAGLATQWDTAVRDQKQATGLGANTPIVAAAQQFLGVPYVWGGNDPKKALDCSAFIQQAYKQLGVNIPRTTQTQVKAGVGVPLDALQPGDAVFTRKGKDGLPNHVGLYIGNGLIQESPHTGDVNKIIPLDSFLTGGFVAARRYLGN